MKRLLVFGLALCFSASVLQANDAAPLYQLGGKSHTTKDLSPALQQSVYEIQRQAYDNLQKVVDEAILDTYVHEEAKKKNITPEKFEETTFKGKAVSEKDAKAWFESNKARLGGREYDSIKKDIHRLLESQESDKVRNTTITKLKKDGKFNFTMPEPQAPNFDINVSGYPLKGSEKGKVRIVEFADYGCGHCKRAAKALKTIVDKYKDKVQFVYLDFPLGSPVSNKVAEGGVCADKQKKFWEYHYMAFGEGPLTEKSPMEFAKTLKLDEKAFEACLKAPETAKKVADSRIEGQRIGVNGTPAIYFNGRKVFGYDEQVLEDELKKLL